MRLSNMFFLTSCSTPPRPVVCVLSKGCFTHGHRGRTSVTETIAEVEVQGHRAVVIRSTQLEIR
jgi:hypothetical protein